MMVVEFEPSVLSQPDVKTNSYADDHDVALEHVSGGQLDSAFNDFRYLRVGLDIDAFALEVVLEPVAGFLAQKLVPEAVFTTDDRRMDAKARQSRANLDSDESGADHHRAFGTLGRVADLHGVVDASKVVEAVAVVSGNVEMDGGSPGGEQELSVFEPFAICQGGKLELGIHVISDNTANELNVVLVEEVVGLGFDVVRIGRPPFEKVFAERGAVVRLPVFSGDDHDRSVGIVFPDRLGGVCGGSSSADEQVVDACVCHVSPL